MINKQGGCRPPGGNAGDFSKGHQPLESRLSLHPDNKPVGAADFHWLEQHTEVRDVLISGGAPLTLSDTELDELFSKVRKNRHIKTVRLGSKIPAVMPSRITPELAELQRQAQPRALGR